jgi:SNF2 family DNA or RNA helicase
VVGGVVEKFYLPSRILETSSFKDAEKSGELNPFDRDDAIILVSYQFAARKAEYIQRIPWNLVVIDEAHRVRNSWQKKNKMGKALKEATAHARKVLLTATPLQNSAMELFVFSASSTRTHLGARIASVPNTSA